MFLALLDQLGFLSGTVLNRARLTEALSDPRVAEFVGSGYVQLFVSVLMMQRHPTWLYVADPCVGWRRDNDSFVERGSLGRLRMDVEGYDRIASAFFPRESPTFRQVRRAGGRPPRPTSHRARQAGRRDVGLHAAGAGACACGTTRASRHSGSARFPFCCLPQPVLRGLRSVYQRARQMAGR